MRADQIRQLLDEELIGTDMFLLDMEILSGNDIRLVIDSPTGVKVSDCVKVNRIIEGRFDREVEDYKLQVTSPGADRPLTDRRQYPGKIGKQFSITLADGTVQKGILSAVQDTIVVLQQEIRVAALGKKGYKLTSQDIEYPFENIKSAAVILSFK